MKLTYTNITREMITEALVGRKVFLASAADREETPNFGHVIAGNYQRSTLWVAWGPRRDPEQHPIARLYLVKDDMAIGKEMRWHGKTLGALEKFVEQARVEGADEDTILNTAKGDHVHISITLPLATDTSPIQDKLGRSPEDPEWGREAGMD